MKLLKIFGIVAGLHAFALLLIFANPGCSSSRSAPAAEAPAPVKIEPTPTIAAVTPVPASPDSPTATITPVPAEPAPTGATEPVPSGGAFYSPTRPGTPAAAALQSSPPVDVTPATAYTVGKGDSLWSIAKKNHLRVSVLAASNHLRVGTTLRPGQKLLIPGKNPDAGAATAAGSAPARAPAAAPAAAGGEQVKHTVRYGETLGTIARHYHVGLGALATANSISDPQKIRPGMELIIPAGGHSTGGKAGGSASAKTGAAGQPPGANAQIPAAGQDLDSGLQSPPPNPVPVIRIDPDAPAPTPAANNAPKP